MSTHAITVISITTSGKQIAVGFKRWNEVKRHLRDRLRYPVVDAFTLFVIVLTRADPFTTTTCLQLTPPAAQRFLQVKEAEKDRWTSTKAKRSRG